MRSIQFLFLFILISCSNNGVERLDQYDESIEIAESADHEKERMRFKLIQSKVGDKAELWKNIEKQLKGFSEDDYNALKPLIFNKSIPDLQQEIGKGELTYKKLTQWYLHRILIYENSRDLSLHTIIAINPEAVAQAESRDRMLTDDRHSIYGMPILLKDNINTKGMPTTAGAVVLKDNNSTNNSYIVSRLENKGAIILGKVNLSEWAYYFCDGCPLGYSAIGGQTLNPYGRRVFETGGSSAGSGTAVAAQYAVAAIGTETSGSILSPSSQNSVVGLKPTIGVLGRSGIVPISSTLDTPGPMTKNVIDNIILLSSMIGADTNDTMTFGNPKLKLDWKRFLNTNSNLNGVRLGAFKSILESDSLYSRSIDALKQLGASVVEVEGPDISLNGFLTLLNLDMKKDLPQYLNIHYKGKNKISTVKDIIDFNLKDTTVYMPYGQARFEGIVSDTTLEKDFPELKSKLLAEGKKYFNILSKQHDLEGFVSVNNYHASYAALAYYPCLAIPMGYRNSGEPASITFITSSFNEEQLYKWGYVFEKNTEFRVSPKLYN